MQGTGQILKRALEWGHADPEAQLRTCWMSSVPGSGLLKVENEFLRTEGVRVGKAYWRTGLGPKRQEGPKWVATEAFVRVICTETAQYGYL